MSTTSRVATHGCVGKGCGVGVVMVTKTVACRLWNLKNTRREGTRAPHHTLFFFLVFVDGVSFIFFLSFYFFTFLRFTTPSPPPLPFIFCFLSLQTHLQAALNPPLRQDRLQAILHGLAELWPLVRKIHILQSRQRFCVSPSGPVPHQQINQIHHAS